MAESMLEALLVITSWQHWTSFAIAPDSVG